MKLPSVCPSCFPTLADINPGSRLAGWSRGSCLCPDDVLKKPVRHLSSSAKPEADVNNDSEISSFDSELVLRDT